MTEKPDNITFTTDIKPMMEPMIQVPDPKEKVTVTAVAHAVGPHPAYKIKDGEHWYSVVGKVGSDERNQDLIFITKTDLDLSIGDVIHLRFKNDSWLLDRIERP